VHADTHCPICSNRLIVLGINDLTTTHPELVKDWAPENPSYLDPSRLSAGSKAWVIWQCEFGHQQKLRVHERAKLAKCTFCSRAEIRASRTSLVETHPEISAQWNYQWNDEPPSSFTPGSRHEAWWICNYGHNFKSRIERRTAGGNCPQCSRRALAAGVNDLATTHPELTTEWLTYMNRKEANQVIAGNRKWWWECLAGRHKYEQSVPHRVQSKGCPECPPADRVLSRPSL
jgi:hypothetical protein